MKILLIGDVYADVGRKMLAKWIPKIKSYLQQQNSSIDFIVVNGENVTHGKSISLKHYQELKDLGVNVITSGNHIFSPSTDILSFIDKTNDVLRPLNYNPYHPGKGSVLIACKNKKIRVTNVIGRTYMDKVDNPYYALEQLLELENNNNNEKSDIHIIDIHAEATAEKIAFAWSFDGRISCVVGTHTHVQTTDNRILPKKTAFISDIGMTGAYYSIIGANPDEVIYRDKYQLPAKFKPADGDGQFAAVILTINDQNNQTEKLERIYITPENENIILY